MMAHTHENGPIDILGYILATFLPFVRPKYPRSRTFFNGGKKKKLVQEKHGSKNIELGLGKFFKLGITDA